MRGQPRGGAAGRRRGPQVAAVGEDDAVAVDVGEAQQLGLRRGRKRERRRNTAAHSAESASTRERAAVTRPPDGRQLADGEAAARGSRARASSTSSMVWTTRGASAPAIAVRWVASWVRQPMLPLATTSAPVGQNGAWLCAGRARARSPADRGCRCRPSRSSTAVRDLDQRQIAECARSSARGSAVTRWRVAEMTRVVIRHGHRLGPAPARSGMPSRSRNAQTSFTLCDEPARPRPGVRRAARTAARTPSSPSRSPPRS